MRTHRQGGNPAAALDCNTNVVSARLQSHPIVRGQARDLHSFAFSAAPAQLKSCSFMIVAYGSNRGDVGYYLPVKDLLDLDTIGK